MNTWYQQGDVAIKPIKIPAGKKTVIISGALVSGAATGHTHRVKGVGAKVYKIGDKIFIKAIKKFNIVHEEHKTIPVPAGTYAVEGIMEYDHFAEEARRVED